MTKYDNHWKAFATVLLVFAGMANATVRPDVVMTAIEATAHAAGIFAIWFLGERKK